MLYRNQVGDAGSTGGTAAGQPTAIAVEVNGEIKHFTPQQLSEQFKAMDAERAKVADLTTKLTAAEGQTAEKVLKKAIVEGDRDAFFQLGEKLGDTPEQLAAAWANIEARKAGRVLNHQSQSDDNEAVNIEMGHLPPDLQRFHGEIVKRYGSMQAFFDRLDSNDAYSQAGLASAEKQQTIRASTINPFLRDLTAKRPDLKDTIADDVYRSYKAAIANKAPKDVAIQQAITEQVNYYKKLGLGIEKPKEYTAMDIAMGVAPRSAYEVPAGQKTFGANDAAKPGSIASLIAQMGADAGINVT